MQQHLTKDVVHSAGWGTSAAATAPASSQPEQQEQRQRQEQQQQSPPPPLHQELQQQQEQQQHQHQQQELTAQLAAAVMLPLLLLCWPAAAVLLLVLLLLLTLLSVITNRQPAKVSCVTNSDQPAPVTTTVTTNSINNQPASLHQLSSSSSSSSSSSNGSLTAVDTGSHHVAATCDSRNTGCLLKCGICFDMFPLAYVVAAVLPNQDARGDTSHLARRCSHCCCQDCMRCYVRERLQSHCYPLCCPSPSCQECLAHEDVLQLLQGQPALQGSLHVFERLAVEHCIDPSQRVYCPFKDCSCLLELTEEASCRRDLPLECPACHRAFCLSCGITGWHTGMTCTQFQALPPQLRSVEDAALLCMAKKNKWKRCPAANCGHMVERKGGCIHIKCRCGTTFCYKCGRPYIKDGCRKAARACGILYCTCLDGMG